MRLFASERFSISLSRSTCLNYLHRLGFAFKRPKKRLLKADAEKREAFVEEYAALAFQSQESGEKIFFADEAHFRADAELRGKWVLRGEPALVDSTSPRYGEKASYYSPAIEPPALGEGGVTKNSGRPTARARSTGGDHDDEGKPVVQPSAGEPRAADLVQ